MPSHHRRDDVENYSDSGLMVYWFPVNKESSFKRLRLTTNQRMRISRKTSRGSAPGEHNGLFDSKLVSRRHAELWLEGSQIFIRDIGSANGTFVNGKRLSRPATASEPHAIQSGDIITLGVDILSEDKTTVTNRKVTALILYKLDEGASLPPGTKSVDMALLNVGLWDIKGTPRLRLPGCA